jgi:hypothetical protein
MKLPFHQNKCSCNLHYTIEKAVALFESRLLRVPY